MSTSAAAIIPPSTSSSTVNSLASHNSIPDSPTVAAPALAAAIAANHTKDNSSPSQQQPLTRPRIIIPSQIMTIVRGASTLSAEQAKEDDEPATVPVITPKPSSRAASDAAGKEKVGRWSEEEHKVFIEGLGKHGKQWKVIAGMIGTRTVVQVRTHAQKYFQRVERHNNSNNTQDASSSGSDKPPQAKRKMSLPASLPSRSKKQKLGGVSKKGTALARSVSASLVSAPATSPTPEMMSTYPSYISNDSSSSDGSWTYTISPEGVDEMIVHMEAFHNMEAAATEAAAVEQASGVVGDTEDEEMYDLGQDPLEWLINAEPSILPESSLPIFPDLSSAIAESLIEASSSNNGSSGNNDDCYGHHSSTVIELNAIADPTVTVQSLFLLPTNDCC